jgi:hypothetical protein
MLLLMKGNNVRTRLGSFDCGANGDHARIKSPMRPSKLCGIQERGRGGRFQSSPEGFMADFAPSSRRQFAAQTTLSSPQQSP